MGILTRWLVALSLSCLGVGSAMAATSQTYDVAPATSYVEFGLLKSEGYQLLVTSGVTAAGSQFALEPVTGSADASSTATEASATPADSVTELIPSGANPSTVGSRWNWTEFVDEILFVAPETWLLIAVGNAVVALMGIMLLVTLRRHRRPMARAA